MARRPPRDHSKDESRLSRFVEATLTAADPFYRGRRRGAEPAPDREIHPLDPAKTARDLGRTEHAAHGEPRVRPSFTAAADTGRGSR